MNFIADLFDQQDCDGLARLVHGCARPAMVVFELGSYTGRSALAMLPEIRRQGGHLFCVDWFRGTPGSAGAGHISYAHHNILDTLRANLAEAGLEDFVTIVVGTTETAARALADACADVIFVDADHRYSQVRRDLEAWYPKLKPGGLMCGHDFERHLSECDPLRVSESCEQDYVDGCHYGVIRAVNEFFPQVQRLGRLWYSRKPALDNLQGDETATLARTFGDLLRTSDQVRLLETNYLGFNLVSYGARVYALATTLGQVSLFHIDEVVLQNWIISRDCFVGADLDQVKLEILSSGFRPYPELIEPNFQGYNLLRYRGSYYALATRLGPVDLQQMDAQEMRRLEDQHLLVHSATLDDAHRQVAALAALPPATPTSTPDIAPTPAPNAIMKTDTHITLPWQRMHVDPQTINPIRSMIGADETLYLYWLAREYYLGLGEIVDAGCLLGGSTVSFGAGLRANPFVRPKAKRIHSFDLFMFFPGFRDSVLPGVDMREGDSLVPLYLENTRAYHDLVQVYPGDICTRRWNGKPIEIFFIDLSKTWDINNHLLAEFFPHLIPNRSIVIQQDYYHYDCYWIHLTMEHFAEHFKRVHEPGGGTVGFILTRPIPAEALAIDYRTYFTTAQAAQLMDRATAREQGVRRLFILTAKARMLIDRHEYDQAAALLQEIRASPDWTDWVLYDVVNTESHLPPALAYGGYAGTGQLTGLSRRYYVFEVAGRCLAVPRIYSKIDLQDLTTPGRPGVAIAPNVATLTQQIGEAIQSRPDFPGVKFLEGWRDYNLIAYQDWFYFIPLVLGPVNIAQDHQRLGILAVERKAGALENAKRLIVENGFPARPQLIQENWNGYNILRFSDAYYALAISLGEINLAALNRPMLEALQADKLCFYGPDLESIRALAQEAGEMLKPELLGTDDHGYNLIRYRHLYYALAQTLGPIDLTRISADEISRLCDTGKCYVRQTLEALKGAISLRGLETIESDYHGYCIFIHNRTVFGRKLGLSVERLINADESLMQDLLNTHQCFVGNSINRVREQIDQLTATPSKGGKSA